MFLLRKTLMLLYTACCAFEDFHTRRVSSCLCLAFATVGAVLLLLQEKAAAQGPEEIPGTLPAALLPGLLCLLLSLMSRGSVGLGDALYLMVAALYMPLRQILWMLVISGFLVCFGVLGILILEPGSSRSKGRGRRDPMDRELPYLTVMLPAYVMLLIFSG